VRAFNLSIRDDDDEYGCTERQVFAWASLFKGIKEHTEFGKWHHTVQREAQELHYGYSITAHASQGSEWDSVIVLDESGNSEDKWHWLYTAVTRAASRVFVLANYRRR
jgi:DNA helicase IV